MDDCFFESLVYSESDNSETEEVTKSPHIPEKHVPSENGAENAFRKIENQLQESKFSDESDEDDFNKSFGKKKKNARILSSDDEMSNDQTLDCKDPHSKVNVLANVRPSICDSETKSSSDGDRIEENTNKLKKKLKKKKQKVRRTPENSQTDSDSDDGGSVKIAKKPHRTPSSSNQSSSGSSSDSNSNDDADGTQNIAPREKSVQRMSAKMAEQQMKEIQSESQRLARQTYINIPYHKPKQHSLKEFLSRRSIVQQQKQLTSKPNVRAAVAIKMSGEDLVQYMEDLEKRTKEAKEFFTQETDEDSKMEANNSDGSEDTEYKNVETMEKSNESESNEYQTVGNTTNLSPTNMIEPVPSNFECFTDIIDYSANDNQTVDKQTVDGTEINSDMMETDVVEIHTARSELDEELDAMSTNEMNKEKKKLSIATDFVPKLKGDKGFVIDLETNDLLPTPKTGVDELLTRFVKNVLVKPQAVETQDVNIFRTDTGTLEKCTVHVSLMDDKKSNRESKPGEGLFKLRSELSIKIKENREKIIAQRLQEEKEQELARKQMESEDEEFDHSSDSDHSYPEAAMNQENVASKKEDEIRTAEDIQKNTEDIESENESEHSEENEFESSDVDLEPNEIQKSRKRIITVDDSDDDTIQQIPTNTENNTQNDDASQNLDFFSEQQFVNESSKSLNSHDLSALESEILQLNSAPDRDADKMEPAKLFQQDIDNDEEIGESQLMALCSGSFATQNLDNGSIPCVEVTQNQKVKKLIAQDIDMEEHGVIRPAFLSSDEEDIDKTTVDQKQKMKKKRKKFVYSDDEEDENNDVMEPGTYAEENRSPVGDYEESDEEGGEEEEEVIERYIEYDSDENEVEVELKKSDVRMKASEFVEKEAELSESEWDSDDEDEKEMNQYEAELGDADNFDRSKLKDELERIRLREQTDDDARDIRILTERFVEEEDNGQERERKFKWTFLNKGDNNDDEIQNVGQDEIGMPNSDDENEAEWRRVRYEREQLLKQQTAEKDSFVDRTAATAEVTEQITVENTSLILNSGKRISIMKPGATAPSKTTSPFLIAKGDLSVGHLSRKSFLNRDSPLLEKLVGLSKTGNENDAILNTAKGKGKYVFVATEKKDSSKRKPESESGNAEFGSINPSKKSKIEPQKSIKIRPQTKAFFDSLN